MPVVRRLKPGEFRSFLAPLVQFAMGNGPCLDESNTVQYQWIGLRENLNRKPWILPINMGLSGFHSPLNQSMDNMIS